MPFIPRLDCPEKKSAEPDPNSATGQIHAHLKSGGTNTPLEALELYGCWRRGAIIFKLRRNYGLDITTKIVEHENGKRFASYSLEK